jgi:hypothetical protein
MVIPPSAVPAPICLKVRSGNTAERQDRQDFAGIAMNRILTD